MSGPEAVDAGVQATVDAASCSAHSWRRGGHVRSGGGASGFSGAGGDGVLRRRAWEVVDRQGRVAIVSNRRDAMRWSLFSLIRPDQVVALAETD